MFYRTFNLTRAFAHSAKAGQDIVSFIAKTTHEILCIHTRICTCKIHNVAAKLKENFDCNLRRIE